MIALFHPLRCTWGCPIMVFSIFFRISSISLFVTSTRMKLDGMTLLACGISAWISLVRLRQIVLPPSNSLPHQTRWTHFFHPYYILLSIAVNLIVCALSVPVFCCFLMSLGINVSLIQYMEELGVWLVSAKGLPASCQNEACSFVRFLTYLHFFILPQGSVGSGFFTTFLQTPGIYFSMFIYDKHHQQQHHCSALNSKANPTDCCPLPRVACFYKKSDYPNGTMSGPT